MSTPHEQLAFQVALREGVAPDAIACPKCNGTGKVRDDWHCEDCGESHRCVVGCDTCEGAGKLEPHPADEWTLRAIRGAR